MVELTQLKEYPFAPKSVSIGSNMLSYLDEGGGPALVCLHGNPTWSYMYRKVVADFSHQYRVIVPDHIGCGLSSKPDQDIYTLKNHVHNLEHLLEHLGITDCILMVHDWGGAIGMGWAVQHVSQVRGVIVLNTAAFRSKRIPYRIALCKIPLLGEFLVRGLNGFARAALKMAVHTPLQKEVASGFLAPYSSWKNRKAVYEFVRDIPLVPEHRSYSMLSSIEFGLEKLVEKPMMICWGGEDFCFTDHFYREWQRRFPGAVAHYFPQAGHYVLEDAYPQMKHLLEGFLAQVYEAAAG